MVMLFHMQTSRYTTSTHKQTNTHYDTPIHTHTHTLGNSFYNVIQTVSLSVLFSPVNVKGYKKE